MKDTIRIGMVVRKCLFCGKEFKVNNSPSRKGRGKFCSRECKVNYFKGKHLSPNTEFTSEQMIGNSNGFKKGQTSMTKGSHVQFNTGRTHFPKGDKHPCWKGGVATIYSVDWTRTFKRSIRERDRYTCGICGEQQDDKAFAVHHIDYNKLNSTPNNLITLCHSCHSKTNHDREKWIKYFNNKLNIKL